MRKSTGRPLDRSFRPSRHAFASAGNWLSTTTTRARVHEVADRAAAHGEEADVAANRREHGRRRLALQRRAGALGGRALPATAAAAEVARKSRRLSDMGGSL